MFRKEDACNMGKNKFYVCLLITILLLYSTSCASFQKKDKPPKLKDCFNIELYFEKDTLLYGDNTTVRIVIKNISEEELVLFPNPWCCIGHSHEELSVKNNLLIFFGCEEHPFYPFNGFDGCKDNPVFNVYKRLLPNEAYLFVIPIHVNAFFHYGSNSIRALFSYDDEGKHIKYKYIGTIMSDSVKVYIKNKQ